MRNKSQPTPVAPVPAALVGSLGEGRAKNALPAGVRVKIRRASYALVGLIRD